MHNYVVLHIATINNVKSYRQTFLTLLLIFIGLSNSLIIPEHLFLTVKIPGIKNENSIQSSPPSNRISI